MYGRSDGRPEWRGAVVSAHVAAYGGAPMRETEEARAAGRGLEGDRYHEGRGYNSYHPGPIRGEVSLIEKETVEALKRDHGMNVAPGETRRNVMTRGVPLNHLVGREFRVGEAILEGVEPCEHLVAVTGKRGLLPNLIHRGGRHARVVKSGKIRRGDAVEWLRSGEAT